MRKERRLSLISRLVLPVVSLWFLFTWISPLNLLTRNSQVVLAMADGSALYGSKCAICHGKNGTGTPAWRAKGQPDLSSSEWQKTRTDEQIATRIKAGKGKMPGFGNKLSDEEIAALVKQVRTLRK